MGRPGKISTEELIELQLAVWGEKYVNAHHGGRLDKWARRARRRQRARRRALEVGVAALVAGGLAAWFSIDSRQNARTRRGATNGLRSQSGIEGGTLRPWIITKAPAGATSEYAIATRGDAHSGSWAMLTRDDGPGDGPLVASRQRESRFAEPAYYSAWLLVPPTLAESTATVTHVMRWGDPAPRQGPSHSVDLILRNVGGVFEPEISTSAGSSRLRAGIVPGRWAHLELYIAPQGPSGARVEVWVDTSSVFTGVADVGAEADRSWSIGWRSTSGSSGAVRWDDMVWSPEYVT